MSELNHGIQIVNVLEDHSYQLDEQLLEQVLMKNDIKDLPVVVVSVAGAYRGGKSFLLNFFIRYLSAPVAVLVMDTQGTFDSNSTTRDNSTIFALSTLLSSVQIYNLSMNIQEDDLQHLQLFTMYGKMVQERDEEHQAFQTLGFLVRDWPYPYEYPFGTEGGNRLLQKRLVLTRNLPEELRGLRNHLRSSFEKVFCFLMPHPGFKVQHSNFSGQINDIEPDFRKHLKELVSLLFSPEKLCPKTINGQKIKAKDMFNYFKAYMILFNSDQIPTPKSIVQATAEAGLLTAATEAREQYEKEMNAECGPMQPGVPLADLHNLHRKCVNTARETFTSKKTMASHVEVSKCLEKLTQDLENRLSQFEQSNLLKLQRAMNLASDFYEKYIKNIGKGRPLCLHPLDLDMVHDEAVQAALKIYDEQLKVICDRPDLKRAELIQIFQNHHVQWMISNDNNSKTIVKDLFMEYQNVMSSKSTNPPLSEADFKGYHDSSLKQALDKFQTKRNRPSSYPSDIYREDLEKAIVDSFCQLEAINNAKIEQERIKQEVEILRQKAEKERQEAEKQRIEQEKILRDEENSKLQLEREKILLEQQRLEIERQIIRDGQRNTRDNNVLSLG